MVLLHRVTEPTVLCQHMCAWEEPRLKGQLAAGQLGKKSNGKKRTIKVNLKKTRLRRKRGDNTPTQEQHWVRKTKTKKKVSVRVGRVLPFSQEVKWQTSGAHIVSFVVSCFCE